MTKAYARIKMWLAEGGWTADLALVLAITLLVALPLRFIGVDSVPPGLNIDEAAEAVDALAIGKDGFWPAFLPANNGREPLFAYVVAGFFALFGSSVAALRAASAFLGLLAVPATYLLAREMFGRRVAVYAAVILGICGWHLHLSRFAVRPVAMVPLLALTLWAFWRALRTGRTRWGIVSGLALGLSMYTYMPARALPIIMLPVALVALVKPERFGREINRRRVVTVLAAIVIVALLVAGPLIGYFAQHPDDFSGRAGQVSIINAIRAGADPAQTIWDNVVKTFGMFAVQGDTNPRHNLPGRPVFDPLLCALAVVGLIVALRRWRDHAHALLVWALLVMLVPACLSDSAPHYLRSAGLLPMLMVLPALGVDALWRYCSRFRRGTGTKPAFFCTAVVAVVPVLLALTLSVNDLFFAWASDERTATAFDVAKIEAGQAAAQAGGSVPAFIGPLEQRDQVLRFVYPSLTYRSFGWTSIALPPIGTGATYYVLNEDRQTSGLLEAVAGARRDSTFVSPSGDVWRYDLAAGWSPTGWLKDTVGREDSFGGEIGLLGQRLLQPASVGSSAKLALVWRALEKPRADYVAFVHLIGPDGFEWVQVNAAPGQGNQPTSLWNKGETVVDVWDIAIPAASVPGDYRVVVGLLDPATGKRLPLLNRAGAAIGSQVEMPVFPVGDIADGLLSKSAVGNLLVSFGLNGEPLVSVTEAKVSSQGAGPGSKLSLTLGWRVERLTSGDPQVVLRLVDAQGRSVGEWTLPFAGGAYPASRWKVGRAFLDHETITLPRDISNGEYELRIGVVDRATGAALDVVGGSATIARVLVNDRARTFDEPASIGTRLDWRLGDGIKLVGYTTESSQAKPGDALRLRLVWQCLQPVGESYTVFVHVLDKGEKVWGQQDATPGGGKLPTDGWAAGEYVEDDYTLQVSPDAPAGEYVIEIGMYLSSTMARLPVLDAGGQRVGDRILLSGSIVVSR